MELDAQAIAELDQELFPDNNMNWKTVESVVGRGRGFVIYRDGQLIGYLLAQKDPTEALADILRLGIRPGHQCKGLGSQLLKEALEAFDDVILTVRKDNRALRFYLRHGFRIIGHLDQSWVMRSTS
jgi:ribosomal protein S18 acetylase RimI-like enzyme